MPTGIYSRNLAKPNQGMFHKGHLGYCLTQSAESRSKISLAHRVIKRDKAKNNYLNKCGFGVLRLSEHEIKDNSFIKKLNERSVNKNDIC